MWGSVGKVRLKGMQVRKLAVLIPRVSKLQRTILGGNSATCGVLQGYMLMGIKKGSEPIMSYYIA